MRRGLGLLRRPAASALALAFVLAVSGSARAFASVRVRAVEAVSLVVSDLDRSLDFFTRVLPFEKESETEVSGDSWDRLEGVFGVRIRIASLRLGAERLELREYLAPRGRPIPRDSRSEDGWFQHVALVVSDMERAYRVLRQHHVEHASSGPQKLPDWNAQAGGIEAFYFKDPDGHVLELIRFPAGKGDPRWQRESGKLFLGIDHTAIVVRDTESSLAFWRDTLGFSVAGESENYGTEQEHLNHVFGARLRITALRASSGPGIELLEYLSPRDGRPYPADTQGDDLWSWQTRLGVDDPAAAASAVRAASSVWVSPGLQKLPAGELGFSRGIVARDPDGHAVVLTGR